MYQPIVITRPLKNFMTFFIKANSLGGKTKAFQWLQDQDQACCDCDCSSLNTLHYSVISSTNLAHLTAICHEKDICKSLYPSKINPGLVDCAYQNMLVA